MQLMTKQIKEKLLRNGDVTNRGNDHKPVVKYFGGGSCTWLITEMDSADDDTLFGLCDLGMGYPVQLVFRIFKQESLHLD